VLLTEQKEFKEEAKDAHKVIKKAIITIAEAIALLTSTNQENANLLLKLKTSFKEAKEMQKEANIYFENGAYADVLKLSKKVRLLAEELYTEVEEVLEALAESQKEAPLSTPQTE